VLLLTDPAIFFARPVAAQSLAVFDAFYIQVYVLGIRWPIHNALQAGATMEIMEVLKLWLLQGVQPCKLRIPILAEELENRL
jgi:hypothetical protein